MSTVAIEQSERIEQLRNSAQEMSLVLARLRTRHTDIAAELDEISAEVRRGRTQRAGEACDLVRQQDELSRTIEAHESDLGSLQSKLKRETEAAHQTELQSLLSRMEMRRARITELAREMALLLGQLQGEDRQRGSTLLPTVLWSLDRARFCELLAPVTPFSDPAWAGAHAEMPVGFEFTIRIPAMRQL